MQVFKFRLTGVSWGSGTLLVAHTSLDGAQAIAKEHCEDEEHYWLGEGTWKFTEVVPGLSYDLDPGIILCSSYVE
jgi:hypothetical protein